MSANRARRILAVELKKLHALEAPAKKALEEMQDAQLVLNEKRAAFDTAQMPFTRYGQFLVKHHRVKADEEFDKTTGEIRKRARPVTEKGAK